MKIKILLFLLASGVVALAAWLVHAPNPAQADDVLEKYRETVHKGLEYLVKYQAKDGHWEGDEGKHPVAMTGLVGLALLMERNSDTKPIRKIHPAKYAANIDKAADWLMDQSQPRRDGLIFSDHPSETSRYMEGHGLAEGLWQRQRRRDAHRRRRPRRACFGELVQMDTSLHEWTEGRGESMVLINMIDDATSRVLARFYPADTVEAHFDLLGRWLQKYGRPLALYTDRHGIFEAHKKGQPDYEGETQFSRALAELDIDLIKAYSPQAKGRVERSFGTAQDRWVKEMRLAKVKTIAEANKLLERLVPAHNQRFSVAPAKTADAHRAVGAAHHLTSILSVQEQRVVSNDYTIRLANRLYQLDQPIYPGERGGKVTIELRVDGTMAIRFGDRYLHYHEITARDAALGGSAPQTPRSLAHLRPTPEGETKQDDASMKEASSPGVKPTNGRSGRTPAEPYPPVGEEEATKKIPYRPSANHPWRKGFRKQA